MIAFSGGAVREPLKLHWLIAQDRRGRATLGGTAQGVPNVRGQRLDLPRHPVQWVRVANLVI